MTREQFIYQVKMSQKALRRFLVALCCGNSAYADDIAQEAYIKAYISCDSIKDIRKFNSWIFKIAYNTYLNSRRGERFMEGYDNILNTSSNESADSSFKYQDLYDTLNRLPPKERISVLLFYMEDYSIKEIAQIQELSQDAVKQHLSRGRKHLREMLTKKD